MELSLPMALVDFIPVVFFALGAIVLSRCLYYSMRSYQFALLSAGSINITAAGALKALWKLLMALKLCDFEKLNAIFFPLQTLGFLLLGLGLVLYVTDRKKGTVLSAMAAPAVYSGTMLFVVLMILGVIGVDISLCILAKRVKKPLAMVFALVSLVFVLGMGYLSGKDFSGSAMNWLAQGVNIIGQGCFLVTVLLLKKAGLRELAGAKA